MSSMTISSVSVLSDYDILLFFNLNFVLGILDPLMLVFLGYSLATREYFSEDLLKAIFNIRFLAKLDSQLERMYIFFNLINYHLYFISKFQLYLHTKAFKC